jgi:predicted transcriptional regulator
MPALRIDMRKIKDALRLKFESNQSHQQIATALGISKGVVTKYVGLAVTAGLDAQSVAAMDEASLERRLLAHHRPSDTFAQVDYGRIHQELGRKGVTPRWPVEIPPPVATPNSPRQDRSDYDDSWLRAMREAASLSR